MATTTARTVLETPPKLPEAVPAVRKFRDNVKDGVARTLDFMAQSEEGAIKVQPDWPRSRQVLGRAIGSNGFVTFMGCVIVMNILLVLIETDRRIACDNPSSSECSANSPGIKVPDRICYAIYIIELVCRLYIWQWKYCCSVWNMIDALIVIVGTLGIIAESKIQNLTIIRLVRVVRVIRILKVITIFHELYLMLASLAGTMRTIFWACIMLVLVLTVLSLIAVEVLNPVQNEIIEEKGGDVCDRCLIAFSSVTRSMVTLFTTIIMGDGITDIFVPLIERDAPAAMFILASVAMVYLGFSNLVLSVIVEKANDARTQDDTYQADVKRQMKKRSELELLAIWEEIDTDGSNSLTWSELENIYENSKTFREYVHGMSVDITWLQYAFSVMDPDGDGTCSFQDFASTLVRLRNTDPGPAAAFITFQMGQVLVQLAEVRAQVAHSHPSSSSIGDHPTSSALSEEVSAKVASQSLNPLQPAPKAEAKGLEIIDVDAIVNDTLHTDAGKDQRAAGWSSKPGNETFVNSSGWRGEIRGVASQREDSPCEVDASFNVEEQIALQLQAADELVELLKEAHEGPPLLNKELMYGPEWNATDLCKRVKGQLGQLIALLPNAQDHARLELFACSARLLGSFGATMPRMLPGHATSSLAAPPLVKPPPLRRPLPSRISREDVADEGDWIRGSW